MTSGFTASPFEEFSGLSMEVMLYRHSFEAALHGSTAR